MGGCTCSLPPPCDEGPEKGTLNFFNVLHADIVCIYVYTYISNTAVSIITGSSAEVLKW